jgi:hypothetical protein
MLNPQNATITELPPTTTHFYLRYLQARTPIATLVVVANYVTENQFVQTLEGLNALVPEASEGADLVLTVSAVNAGGESTATACPTDIQVINTPTALTNVEVS